MSNHGYHTRNNNPPTENQTPQQSNVSTDQSSNDETSLIARLESKLLSRFDNLATEILNLKSQIVHSSFNLNLSYPPPYQGLIWDCKKADSKNIRKALDSVNWVKLFDQLDIKTQVAAFNETILNVF